jgi:hypothetical protein
MRVLLLIAALGALAYVGLVGLPDIGSSAAPQGPDVIIFFDPAAPEGYQAERFFRSRGLSVQLRDISADAVARAEHVRRGARELPMILIDRQQLDGFREWEAERILDQRKRK